MNFFFCRLSSPIGDFPVIFVFFCVSVPPPVQYKSAAIPGPLTADLGGPKRAEFRY